MIRLKKIKKIKDSVYNCDLHIVDFKEVYNVNLDTKNRKETIEKLSDLDIEMYLVYALDLIKWYEERGKEVPEETYTAWY